MRVLFLSHCAPDRPDKGEKVRAYNVVRRLAPLHELHVVCLARQRSEIEGLRNLKAAASVYAELVHPRGALLSAAVPFLFCGESLNAAFYRNRKIVRRVRDLAAERPFDAAIVYTSAVAQYVPPGTPYLFDLQDVDSEKWFQYGDRRFPGFLYRMEARRLRRKEVEYARAARKTYLVTPAEEALFRGFAGDLPTAYIENGWTAEAYDPATVADVPALAGRRYVVLVGTMDYYPNVEGAVWFADEVFPELRRQDPALEYLIVGRQPAKAVAALARRPGIQVTGAVPDPRAYLRRAIAALAPLKLARGIQMKVIESLSMGCRTLVSTEVARTFGAAIPPGVVVCTAPSDYRDALASPSPWPPEEIAATARQRFDGYRNLEILERDLDAMTPVPR